MIEELTSMARVVTSKVLEVPVAERGRKVGMGADGTPTSFIDKVAEDAVLEFMDEHDIRFNLLSEEAGFVDRGYDELLVIDPVDGTHNASWGIPFFSISIALGRQKLSDVRLGLVLNMASGDIYRAERGRGAYLNDRRVNVKKPGEDMVLMAYMGDSASRGTYELAARFRRVRALGCTSLDLCAVAGGQADAYYLEYHPVERSLRVMDIAAGVLILREAGGQAYTPKGEILDMPLSLDVRKNIMAVGSKEAMEVMG